MRNYQLALVSVLSVVQEVKAYLQRMAETAQVQLVLRCPQKDDVCWLADRSALFTLLKNLLENAIQHAPAHTQVEIKVSRDAIRVRDFGPGVSAETLDLLFERFWRAPQRRDQGAGLGLSICQEIALAHHWSLGIEPAEPGLRFTLTRATSARP